MDPQTAPAQFAGDWITPGHPDYPSAIARWALNAQRKAKVVAFVKTNDDVVLVLHHAKQHNLPLAIRGGGHSTGGASSVLDGIVIDLSRYFAEVTVDADKKVAYVGGGALWKSVDTAAIKHGLATVAGTVNHTGVGGLTLGGGYGFLTGQHGLALDNLLEVTVVTASGSTLKASSSHNTDLFWAIRGSSCNFGVVTQFVFQLHPQRATVFGGTIIFPPTANERLMQVLSEWWTKGLNEKEAGFHGITVGPDGKPCILMILFWNGSERDGRDHFKAFFDVGPVVDHCAEVQYEQLNAMMDQPHGKNYYMKGVFTTRPQSANFTSSILERVEALAIQGVTTTVVFEYMPTAKVLSVPNHATAHIRGKRVSSVIIAAWGDASEDQNARLMEVKNQMDQIAESLLNEEMHGVGGLSKIGNTGYGNYISDDPEVPGMSSGSRVGADALFGANYPRLQALKRSYDPESIFSRWCPITPSASA